MNDVPWSIGYGTNGFTDHPLPSALDVLEGEGYTAVALTLGHPHLDPFAPDWRAQTEALSADLRRRGLRVVVETGARYLLDPVRKHRPTLVDRNAEPRMVFLRRAIEIAAILGADCVSLWSGVLPDDVTLDAARVLLDERLLELTGVAAAAGVPLALEPEPGMVVETVADALAVRARLGHPAILGITVDLGHCVVVEPDGVVGALRAAGALLRNVQADDMLPHAHEHLPFGEGALDLDAALAALRELDYRGVVAVELPRHAHAAPALARASMAALTAASARSAAASGAAVPAVGGAVAGPAVGGAVAGPAGGGDSAAGGDPATGGSPGVVASSPPGASSRGAERVTTGGPGAGGGPDPLAASSAGPSPSAPHGASGGTDAPSAPHDAGGGTGASSTPAAGPHPWTIRAVEQVRRDAASAARLFAAAGREVGREPLTAEPFAPTADDAARAAIIAALADGGADPAAAVALYRRGDDAERRGVLRGLDAIADPTPAWRDAGLDLVLDALRANDTRLVAAALGSFAAAHLDDHAWRHGVLKCVFLGIPLSVVVGLDVRTDDELAAMAARFAEERRAAGRTVPDDLALISGADGAGPARATPAPDAAALGTATPGAATPGAATPGAAAPTATTAHPTAHPTAPTATTAPAGHAPAVPDDLTLLRARERA
ncbi:sugar phosphate isomerase/epimerase [Microbacterium sp. SORGH_AS 1204]|uniref:EboA domain-containing protein n=1 Tax=Microbacterium sp. SORGH_AS_1204 TaxID=3041785 RepID=UPI00279280F2|nr:EboA domain-containing protein [Microbacterium sp. SORGH_AS_1204]MDQ1135586.1 sugar phosphate isomerase/epimerase [Microbacterium sp. SORGH_AS_1204]